MPGNDEILESVRANEEILKKLLDIEIKILPIDNFKELFEKLIQLMGQEFNIPHVWISLARDKKISYLTNVLESSILLKERLNVIKKEAFFELVDRDKEKPILINENLRPFYRLLPKNQKYFIKSIAVIPFSLNGKIIGSMNLGDYSELRFQPSMDTFFLSQLSVKISICLSNVAKQERLRNLTKRPSNK